MHLQTFKSVRYHGYHISGVVFTLHILCSRLVHMYVKGYCGVFVCVYACPWVISDANVGMDR